MLRPSLGVLALLLFLPASAMAHGLGGEAADTSTLGFVPLGIKHMLLGWDHLLFIAGVVLLAGELGRAAKLISTFVVGHSLTLMLASLNEWRLNPTAVDVVIALSVLTVGVIGFRGRPKNWTPIYVMVGGFGLIHGFGLATRLLDLGLPDAGIFAKVVAFNVGLEIGQLLAIAVILGIFWIGARLLAARWVKARRIAYAGLIVVGLVAAAVLSFPDIEDPSAPKPVVADGSEADDAGGDSCVQIDQQIQPGFGGGHAEKPFYEPGELAPEQNFAHSLGDGYAVIRYSADLPADQLDQLRELVTGSEKSIVGGESPDQADPVTVTTVFRQLSCAEYDQAEITAFTDAWFADLDAGRFG